MSDSDDEPVVFYDAEEYFVGGKGNERAEEGEEREGSEASSVASSSVSSMLADTLGQAINALEKVKRAEHSMVEIEIDGETHLVDAALARKLQARQGGGGSAKASPKATPAPSSASHSLHSRSAVQPSPGSESRSSGASQSGVSSRASEEDDQAQGNPPAPKQARSQPSHLDSLEPDEEGQEEGDEGGGEGGGYGSWLVAMRQRVKSKASGSQSGRTQRATSFDASGAINAAIVGAQRLSHHDVLVRNLDTGESFSLGEINDNNGLVPDGRKSVPRRRSVVSRMFRKEQAPAIVVPTPLGVGDSVKVHVQHKSQMELTNVKLLQRLSAHNGPIWGMQFSPDAKFLATAGQDKVLCVWRTVVEESECSLKRDPVRSFKGHTADILDLTWSKNNFLLTASMDMTVRLWHPSREECLCFFQHFDFVTAVAFHPSDDKFFLSVSLDEKLRIWHIPEHRCVRSAVVGEIATAACFSPDGGLCLVGTYHGHVNIYHTQSLEMVGQVEAKPKGKGKGKKVTGITFTRDGKLMLVTTNDSRLRVYAMHSNYSFTLTCKFKGLKNQVSQIRASFSPKSEYVVCGSEDHRLLVWNRECPQMFKGQLLRKGRPQSSTAFEAIDVSEFGVTVALFAPPRFSFKAKRQSSFSASLPSPPTPPVVDDERSESLCEQVLLAADMEGTVRIYRNDGLPKPLK